MRKITCVAVVLVLTAVFMPQAIVAQAEGSVFEAVAGETQPQASGVKEISYDQFTRIRNSGEAYTLIDALSEDSFKEGHIDGSISMPADSINNESAGQNIPKGSNVVVYCGSFKCGASTDAAQKLSAMGYNVLDYKGGLKDWQEKGNKLVK